MRDVLTEAQNSAAVVTRQAYHIPQMWTYPINEGEATPLLALVFMVLYTPRPPYNLGPVISCRLLW